MCIIAPEEQPCAVTVSQIAGRSSLNTDGFVFMCPLVTTIIVHLREAASCGGQRPGVKTQECMISNPRSTTC